jgi:ABC-2 type transport system permease protein
MNPPTPLNPRRVWSIMLRQFYLMRGSPARVLPLFIWVGVDIVLWGFITRYLNTIASPGFNFIPALLGAVLLWDFFTRVMHGVTTAFFEDVWSRNFLNIFAAPLSIAEYLAGLVGTSIITSLIGLIVMMVMAGTLFGLSYLAYGGMFALFLLALFLFGIALGIIGISVVLRFGPASEWFIWPIPALVSPFAGVFYPIATLPHWMQTIAGVLPPSYVFEGMRTIVHGGSASPATLLAAALLAMAYILLACLFFVHVFRTSLRTGRIARYSAESSS